MDMVGVLITIVILVFLNETRRRDINAIWLVILTRKYLFPTPYLFDAPKVHLMGYNSVADNTQYWSIFIRLAVIASETREMSRNSKRI